MSNSYDPENGVSPTGIGQTREDWQRPILGPGDAFNRFLKPMMFLDREEIHAVVLDLENIPLLPEPLVIATGTIDEVAASIPQIWRRVVSAHPHAAQVLLAHNHVVSSNAPSDPDLSVTIRWMVGSDILGLHLLDHLVISRSGPESCMRVLKARRMLQDARLLDAAISGDPSKLDATQRKVFEAKMLLSMGEGGRGGTEEREGGIDLSDRPPGGIPRELMEMINQIGAQIIGTHGPRPTKKGDETIH